MNFPGIAKGNWRWRMKDGALPQQLAHRLRSITMTNGRQDGETCPGPRCQGVDLKPEIAKRAYELYERRGRQNGQTVQDWLHTEWEIKMEAKP